MVTVSSERVGPITSDPQTYFGISQTDDLFADVVSSYAQAYRIVDLKFNDDGSRYAFFDIEDEDGNYLLMIQDFNPGDWS